MPHKSGYGNDKKMPKESNDSYEGGYEDGMSTTQSDKSYFRPMDSNSSGENSHEY